MQGQMGLQAIRVGPDECVVDKQIGHLGLGEELRGIGKVTKIRQGTEVQEFANGIGVAVETTCDENGVNNFELVHVRAPLCK